MANVTRGGLTPGKLVNLTSKKEVNFMFNPVEYTLKKENTWKPVEASGVDETTYTFDTGKAITMSLTLWFDTLMDARSREKPFDVRYVTKDLWDMMVIADSGSQNQKAAPPLVEFRWGKLIFKSFITSLEENFTLFDADGIPVRSKVTVNLTHHGGAGKPKVTSIAAPQSVSTTLTDADRADLVASFMLGLGAAGAGTVAAGASAVASATRNVMENNDIDNPLDLNTGSTVSGA